MTISGSTLCPDSAGWQLCRLASGRLLAADASSRSGLEAAASIRYCGEQELNWKIVRRGLLGHPADPTQALTVAAISRALIHEKPASAFSRAAPGARLAHVPAFPLQPGCRLRFARYLHSLSGGTANSHEKSEKLHAYTNLTRLKSFVNLQLDLDPLHYSSLFLFALGDERTRF
jgi:hypothetical protein